MKQPKTLAEFNNELVLAKQGGRATIVDFTATWCPPCQKMGPIFEALEEKYPMMVFLKVDVDENQETAKEYRIEAMPTFKAFFNGGDVGTVVGADTEKLFEMVDKENRRADSWHYRGSGRVLSETSETNTDDDAALSPREKRLAALAKRGIS